MSSWSVIVSKSAVEISTTDCKTNNPDIPRELNRHGVYIVMCCSVSILHRFMGMKIYTHRIYTISPSHMHKEARRRISIAHQSNCCVPAEILTERHKNADLPWARLHLRWSNANVHMCTHTYTVRMQVYKLRSVSRYMSARRSLLRATSCITKNLLHVHIEE